MPLMPVPSDEEDFMDEWSELPATPVVCTPCEEAPVDDLPVFKWGRERTKGVKYMHPKHGPSLYLGKGNWACPHYRRRSYCKECGGNAFCKHNRYRYDCKECGGKGICEHNNRRSECRECGGACICKHNKQRDSCKDCNGSQICPHKKQRNQCKECNGSKICKHGIGRSNCRECGNPLTCPGDGKNECPYRMIIDKNKNRYDLHCLRCFVSKHANATDPTLRARVSAAKSHIHTRELT
eukprot:899754-Prymnesium_polylepis.1